jgi:RNA polymerase sigma factor (TIGR02999 family)
MNSTTLGKPPRKAAMLLIFADRFNRLLPAMAERHNIALDKEIDSVYVELKRLAQNQLRSNRAHHTLSATALVHEAYLKLASSSTDWNDRNHFLGIASNAMRQILVNYAEARNAEKRGGGWLKLTLTSAEPYLEKAAAKAVAEAEVQGTSEVDVVALDHALRELESLDARQAKIVELRYFGGLSIDDTADVLSLSPATVKRDWTLARLFLKTRLST